MATIFAPFAENHPQGFRRVTEITYLGQVYGTMVAPWHMQEAGRAQRIAESLEMGIAGDNEILLMKGERLGRPDVELFLPDGRHNGLEPSG
jgi:hypothetical protein